jgi:hypothetical protein
MSLPSCQTHERSGATLCDETVTFRDLRRPTSGNEFRSRVALSFARFDYSFPSPLVGVGGAHEVSDG